MKIAILGPYTFPDDYSIKDYLSSEEKFYHNNEHTHPWISNLALGLSKIKGNDVHIIMLIPGISKDKILKLDNVNYHLLKTTPKTNQIVSFFNSNKNKVHKYLKKINPDIVHGQSRGRDSYFAVTSGYPCVITNHGQVNEHFIALNKKNIQFRIAKRFENKVNCKMNWCISVSPNCTEDCKKYIPESKIFQIDNAINYLFFKEYTLKYQNRIIYIGNITKLKRVFDLVKAIEIVRDAELWIISNVVDKVYFYEIKSYIENNNLLKKVTFIKKLKQDELAMKIADCTALCLPSAYESFGMVLAEAMAVGIPVIASNVGGIPYVVKDKETGFLFETGNIKELSGKIEYLIKNKNEAIKMGKSAKEDARKRWHPDIVAEKTFEVYKKVLNQ